MLVNVKVLLTVNTIDSFGLFLLWTPYYTIILALQLIREQKNTKKVYWFMLMVSSTLLDNILPCCSLIKNSALECQNVKTQKPRAQISMRASQWSVRSHGINKQYNKQSQYVLLRVQVLLEIPIFLCHRRERRFEESTTAVMRPTPNLKRKITDIQLQLQSAIQIAICIQIPTL